MDFDNEKRNAARSSSAIFNCKETLSAIRLDIQCLKTFHKVLERCSSPQVVQPWEHFTKPADRVNSEGISHVPLEVLQEQVHHGNCPEGVLATVKRRVLQFRYVYAEQLCTCAQKWLSQRYPPVKSSLAEEVHSNIPRMVDIDQLHGCLTRGSPWNVLVGTKEQ